LGANQHLTGLKNLIATIKENGKKERAIARVQNCHLKSIADHIMGTNVRVRNNKVLSGEEEASETGEDEEGGGETRSQKNMMCRGLKWFKGFRST